MYVHCGMKNDKKIQIRLPESLLDKVNQKAKGKVSKIIREFLEEFVNESE